VAVVIGTVSIIVYLRSRRRPPAPRPVTRATQPTDAATSLRQLLCDKVYAGWKVCVTYESLAPSGPMAAIPDVVAAKFRQLCSSADVYVLCRVDSDREMDQAISRLQQFANSGLRRTRVLFCSTSKGYEAFTRQLSPTLLITTDVALAQFLAKFLPYVVLIGETVGLVDKQNMISVPTVAELVL